MRMARTLTKESFIAAVVTVVALVALFAPTVHVQTGVANTAADLAGKILMVADSATGRTVTNLFTFDRGAAVPFAIGASSLKVTNFDADKLDGQDGTFYNSLTNSTGALAIARLTNGTFTMVASSTASNQNNWAPGLSGNTGINWSGASDITVTGFAGGVSGQLIAFHNTGTHVATFSHNSGSSSAGNKLFNIATSAGTPVAAGGSAIYQYDGTQWQLVYHEQGAYVTPTYSGSNYAGSGFTWTVDSGDVSVQKYYLKGRSLTVAIALATTTIGSSPGNVLTILNGAWGGFTIVSGGQFLQTHWTNDTASFTAGIIQANTGTSATLILLEKAGLANWTAQTNTLSILGSIELEVQ